jgi:hypothetical protein
MTPVMVYRFMWEHKRQYTIREKDMSFRGVKQRLLQMGEERGIGRAGQEGRRTDRPYSGDSGKASLSVWQSAGAGRTAEYVWETGESEESSPFNGVYLMG